MNRWQKKPLDDGHPLLKVDHPLPKRKDDKKAEDQTKALLTPFKAQSMPISDHPGSAWYHVTGFHVGCEKAMYNHHCIQFCLVVYLFIPPCVVSFIYLGLLSSFCFF